MANNKIKSAILDVVNEQDRPINRRALFGIMVKTHKDIGFVHNDDFESSLDELAKEGKINILSKTGMIAKPRTTGNIDLSNKMEGTIHLNNAGNGFITIAGEEKARYYVYKLNMSNAQNGDTIEFATTDRKMEKEGGLIDAVVTKIISHAKDFYVGTFHKEQNGYKVALDDLSVSLDIKLDSTDGLVEGTKILIQIAKYEGNVAYGTVSRIIGHASDVGVDILSIVYDNGVEPDFPDPVLAYAKEIKLDVNEQQKKIRKDLTE
jgi:ribonuclease R